MSLKLIVRDRDMGRQRGTSRYFPEGDYFWQRAVEGKEQKEDP